jgi:hypothetical protein
MPSGSGDISAEGAHMTRDPVVVEEDGAVSTFHISWGAVFAGVFVSLGLWLLLHTLGLAAGLTAINPDNPGTLRGIGIGTGIWSIVAPLIALFVGGLVASRTAGPIDRGTGAVHGAVLWGLTTLLGVVLIAVAISSAVGAGLRAGGAILGAAGKAAPSPSSLPLDVNDVLGPVNQRLQQQGAPPVTAAQIQAATRDAVSQATRQGRLDRETVIAALVGNTGLDRADAEQVATRIESQFNQSLGELRHGALETAEATGKALWAVFFAMLLGLISAVAGAIVGVSRRQRGAIEAPVAPPTPTPVRPVERRVPIETP